MPEVRRNVMSSIRVMTFNVRGAPEDDGINIWKNRAKVNLDVISKAEPDVIGFQEVQDANLSAYLEKLEGYEFEPGPICNRILFRTSRNAIASCSCRNSPTPPPRSRREGLPCQRFPGSPKMLNCLLVPIRWC